MFPWEHRETLHVYKLKNAMAADVAKVLSSYHQNISNKETKEGYQLEPSLLPARSRFPRTRRPIPAHRSTSRDYQLLKTAIEDLDRTQRQVFIEGVILEVSLDKQRNLGTGIPSGGGSWEAAMRPLFLGDEYTHG